MHDQIVGGILCGGAFAHACGKTVQEGGQDGRHVENAHDRGARISLYKAARLATSCLERNEI